MNQALRTTKAKAFMLLTSSPDPSLGPGWEQIHETWFPGYETRDSQGSLLECGAFTQSFGYHDSVSALANAQVRLDRWRAGA